MGSFRFKQKANQVLSHATALFCTSSDSIIARFTKVPCRLFYLTNSKKIVIREKLAQEKKDLYLYEYTASLDGNIHPAPLCNTFIGPNGLTLKPADRDMFEFVASGNRKTTRVIEIPEGTDAPEGLVFLHEHDNKYSLQPSRTMKPSEFIALVGKFVKSFRVLTRDEYVEAYPYMNKDRKSLLK